VRAEWRARGVPSVPGAWVQYIGGGYMDVSEVVVLYDVRRPDSHPYRVKNTSVA